MSEQQQMSRLLSQDVELAELRAELERLKQSTCAEIVMHKQVSLEQRLRAEKAEAACVALRDKLRATAHQVAVLNQVHRDAFLMGSLAEIDESICKLLADPAPARRCGTTNPFTPEDRED